MKLKKIGSMVLAAALIWSTTAAAAAAQSSPITVYLNDAAVDFSPYGAEPYVEGDAVMLPICALAGGLGLELSWDGASRTVEIQGRDKIVLTIDAGAAVVNGAPVTLDTPARIAHDRTYVSLSFLSETLNAKAEWDEASGAVTLDAGRKGGMDGMGGMNGMGGNGMGNNITTGAQGDRAPVTETDPEITAVIREGAEKFTQFTFEDEENGISLEYSLYIPENYDGSKEYPLLMYIPDASGASKSAKELVEQYYGADIWVTDEEQAKHEAFVLVPAFSVVVVDDNWNTSEEIETAVHLIRYLTEAYSIDTDRLYTTGQSMGCMTSIYLNSQYPDLFAASLFVSGQWDISVLKPLEGQTFFYITAGGDEKASGGQDEVKAMFDADGVGYSYGTWSAQNSQEEQSAAAQRLIAQGFGANMIRFEKGTVLNGGSGMEHNASFNYGYKIQAVRDWLFEQSKEG